MPQSAEKVLEKAKFRLLNGLPMTTGQAAILAGCDPKTVANWIRDGKLTARQSPGGHWLIPSSEVMRVIAGEEAA